MPTPPPGPPASTAPSSRRASARPRTASRNVTLRVLCGLLVVTATAVTAAAAGDSTASVAVSSGPAAGEIAPTDQTRTAEPEWVAPLGYPIEIAQAFRPPAHRYAAGHRGIDLRPSAQVTHVPVFAPQTGTVSYVGTVAGRPVISVRVDARTVYSLEPVSSELREGDFVARGAALGTLASGGHCTDCVHFGVRVNDDYVNPAVYLLQRPVLLPVGKPK